MMHKSLFVLALGLLASSAQATGFSKKVFECGGGAGEDAASVKVTYFSASAPGGPVSEWYEARATASWFGGTHDSTAVKVKKVEAADGGPTSYVNADAKFSVEVYKVDAETNGRVRRVDVKSSFVDPKTKMEGSIRRRWLPCR